MKDGLVDPISEYTLSLGNVENGNLKFYQTMVYPYTYTQFIITEESTDEIN